MAASKNVGKYLSRYAEPEAAWGARVPHGLRYGLALPVFDEEPAPVLTLLEGLPARDVLAVVVVNRRVGVPSPANQRMIEALAARFGEGPGPHAASFGALLVLDRHSEGRELPADQGVGLARKIGLDVLLSAYAADKLACPMAHTTDADALLPHDYFVRAPLQPGAVWYPFVHRAVGPLYQRAVDAYELTLRYYEHGLRWAGSPYAFQAVGSTLAVHLATYAEVRGMPRRQAGEDFHFLAKVAKVAQVACLGGAPLILDGRPSHRVPFGTGKGVRRLLAESCPEAVPAYHPTGFDWLRDVQRAAAAGGSLLTDLHGPARRAVTALRLDAAWERARAQSPRPDVQRRHWHQGLDALRTLKLIHWWRDHELGTLPMTQAMAGAPFWPAPANWHEWLGALRAREQGGSRGERQLVAVQHLSKSRESARVRSPNFTGGT